MEYKVFKDKIVLRLDIGEEIVESIKAVAKKEKIALASVSGLGATDDITVGVFNTHEKKYYANHFTGDMEIVSLTGTVTTMDGEVYIHLHIACADASGRVVGGHLNSAKISATCEAVLSIIDGKVDRNFDKISGLNLIKF